MLYTPPDYHTSRPIGSGQSNPGDVRRLRAALRRTGHGHFPRKGASNVTPGLMDAVRNFQSDFGLAPDGVVLPGGPTERALSMALSAQSHGGETELRRLRDTFARRAEAGLTFAAHPKDAGTGVWTDPSGRMLSDAEAETSAARPDTQVAMMLEQLRKEGGSSRDPFGVRRALEAIRKGIFDDEDEKGAPGKEIPEHPGAAERSVPPKNLKTGTPPFPPEPPPGLDNDEMRPAEERGPTVLVSPIPEQGKPQIEIFPDQSNLIEQWIIQENSRGLPHLQQKDLQYAIDGLYRRLEEHGLLKYYVHIAGGRTAAGSADPGRYMKERTVWPEDGGRVGSRRSDHAIYFRGRIIDFNIVDLLRDRKTPTPRERRAVAGLIANKKAWGESGETFTIGKSKGMTWEEYTANADRYLDIIVEEMIKRMDW